MLCFKQEIFTNPTFLVFESLSIAMLLPLGGLCDFSVKMKHQFCRTHLLAVRVLHHYLSGPYTYCNKNSSYAWVLHHYLSGPYHLL